MRGTEGPGTLLWPWHDVRPDEPHFVAANLLTMMGIWRADPDNVFFRPDQVVTRGELASALARLCRALPEAKDWPAAAGEPRFTDVSPTDPNRPYIEAMIAWGDFGPQRSTFQPNDPVPWSTLNRWLGALHLPTFPSLAHPRHASQPLNRAECVDYLHRVLLERGSPCRTAVSGWSPVRMRTATGAAIWMIPCPSTGTTTTCRTGSRPRDP
ncbi:MAG: S-layer homology domain-containing protein [Verrucomicrobiales bacterium]